MLAGMSLGTDIKRYSRGTMPRIAIVAIILMPLLYGAMYLWAFWNPFGEVNKIPAALVNADHGTVVEGQGLKAGDQVTQSLLDSGQLDLAVVSAEDARTGLEDGKYYFTITLPENFSEAIASPMSENPQKAELEFTYNDTNNYLSTVIGQNAAAQVLNQVNDAVGTQTLEQVIAKVMSAVPQVTVAVDGSNALAGGLGTAKDGSDQLAAGTAELSGAINSVVGRLDGNAGQLQGLPADLQADLEKLQAAGNELNIGASQLRGGLGELSAGANQLADGLDQASSAVPNLTPEQQKKIAETVAGPVELKESNLHEAPTFGTGFAPFFLSLALFVGGIITWMLLTPLQQRPVSNGLGAIRVALTSYWPALLIGFAQAGVMYVVVHFGVGLTPAYVWGTIAFLILISATWLAIIQALNAVFGTAVGRVATLATLMLMLVASGGIYPVETTAKPFQMLHPYDPMTYTVNGLRQLTVGGIDQRLWTAVAVLVGLTLVSLLATALSARRNRQFTMERLYPPIEV